MSNKPAPLLIRDDGMLYPNTPRTRAQAGFWPYHGNPRASLKERMEYLEGRYVGVGNAAAAAETGVFDVEMATKAELLEHALTEFGKKLDARKSEAALRQEIKGLATADDLIGE